MSETAERPHRRPLGAPRNGLRPRCDSGPDRTAPEVDMDFDFKPVEKDLLDDMLDKWRDDCQKGT